MRQKCCLKNRKISENLVASQNTLQEKLITANEKANCTSNLALQSKNEELAEILLKEKHKRTVHEICTRNLNLQWNQASLQRRKFYKNFVKNYKKHQLYTEWMGSSPNFLPLKYKPKRIPGETPNFTDARIREAQQKRTRPEGPLSTRK